MEEKGGEVEEEEKGKGKEGEGGKEGTRGARLSIIYWNRIAPEGSLHAKNQLYPSRCFDRTPTCVRQKPGHRQYCASIALCGPNCPNCTVRQKKNNSLSCESFLILDRNWLLFFTRIKESISYNSVYLISACVKHLE